MTTTNYDGAGATDAEPGRALLLTDDEVMALVSTSDVESAVMAPTVSAEDDAQAEVVVLRGLRSLAVRGLLREDGSLGDQVSWVADTLTAPHVRVVHYIGDEALRRTSDKLLVCWRSVGGRWLREGVSENGTHAFRDSSVSEARDELHSSLEAAFQHPQDDAGAAFLCVARLEGDHVIRIGCASGRVHRADGDEVARRVGSDLSTLLDVVAPSTGSTS